LYFSWLYLLSNLCWLSLLIVIANFITTFSKLTSLAKYSFWEICVKSALILITYPKAVFIVEDMLNALILSQTTDINEITRRNFLSSQILAVLNFTLLLLIYGQPNTKALWAYLQTLIGISGLVLVFADY